MLLTSRYLPRDALRQAATAQTWACGLWVSMSLLTEGAIESHPHLLLLCALFAYDHPILNAFLKDMIINDF